MDKLQIKTITCHDVYNYGASLQAYALMKFFEKLGHDVEIIDYKPDYLKFNLWSIGKKWNKNLLFRMLYHSYVVPKKLLQKKRREKFDEFTRKKLKCTSITYHSFEELKNNTPEADIYIAGSDQIWNTTLPNGLDPSFYLAFAPPDSIKASYAASFSVSKIDNSAFEFVRNNLRNLDYISVREKTGLDILESMKIDKGVVVLDPVLLLDSSHWSKLADYESKEKYIFIYDQENNKKLMRAAQKLSKRFNLKIYAIESLYPLRYADKRIKDAGPEEFLGLINNCEICITNSYHCMVFSIIFSKTFFLFKRTHLSVNSRMIDLLRYLNLCDRVVKNELENIEFTKIPYK